MQKKHIFDILKKLSQTLPKFEDGRINYSGAPKAVVIDTLVKYKDRLLLLKRSDKVANYKGKWNVVSGYLDELKEPKQKALEELSEEIGIVKDDIASIRVGDYYEFFDKEINKTWIINPVLVELKRMPNIKLDWEHSEYKWILPNELENYDIISDIKILFKKMLN